MLMAQTWMIKVCSSLLFFLVFGRFRSVVGFAEFGLWAGRNQEHREVGESAIPGNTYSACQLLFASTLDFGNRPATVAGLYGIAR